MSRMDSMLDGRAGRIAFDPARSHPVTRLDAARGAVRVLLDRSRESADRGEPSQDYFAVRLGPGRISFAVTDGVGSSFLADLAARILAELVVDWLHALEELPDEGRLSAGLEAALHAAMPPADELIAAYRLPPETPAVVRDALERQRAYGSEAMVACGCMDWSERDAGPRVGAAWLGDAQIRLQLAGGGTEDLTGSTGDRWSTRRGPRGNVAARVLGPGEVTRVLAISDGLRPLLDDVAVLSDADLDAELAGLALGDDVVLVDVAADPGAMPPPTGGSGRRRPEIPDREPAPAADPVAPDLEPPHAPRPGTGGPDQVVTWPAVTDAEAYCVELAEREDFAEPLVYRVEEPRLHLPAVPGPMWVRVRAEAGARTSAWSPAYRPAGHPGVAPR